MLTEATFRDINGREVRAGDLIRIHHYVDGRTRRRVYMHKLVVRHDGKLVGADLEEIADTGGWHGTRTLLLDFCGGVEIIDGPARTDRRGGIECWYERPRVKTASSGLAGD